MCSHRRWISRSSSAGSSRGEGADGLSGSILSSQPRTRSPSRFFWSAGCDAPERDPTPLAPAPASWGPVPLPVRADLAGLVHLALLKLASSAPAAGVGVGGAARRAALESLARHGNLPKLPEGESPAVVRSHLLRCARLPPDDSPDETSRIDPGSG